MDAQTNRLHLDILEIEAACDTAAYSARYGALSDDSVVPYLDLTTGEVFWHSDESEEEPDWDHLLPFPDNTSRLESGDLMEFAGSIDEKRMRESLVRLAQGCGAVRKVRERVLDAGDIALRHAWRCFEQRKQRERIMAWLQQVGIEPVWSADIFAPPLLPDRRLDMLQHARDFLTHVRTLRGVVGVALTGGLATAEPHPADVTIVVAVENDADLAPIAKLARRLVGSITGLGDGRWGTVLFTDPSGAYLGRACPWKECRPGIRMACQAEHCGRRPHLYDDLMAFTPEGNNHPWPPVRLFPSPDAAATSLLPADTARELLA